MVTQDRVKELLNYHPDTGKLTWRVNKGPAYAGSVAGYIANGYVRIRIDGKGYLAHRLVWLYTYGQMPKEHLDHINHNRADNRLSNLREVTQAENNRNLSKSKRNTSGITGVSFHKLTGLWVAQIQVNSKQIKLGAFGTIEEAAEARKLADIQYNFHENHGIKIKETHD